MSLAAPPVLPFGRLPPRLRRSALGVALMVVLLLLVVAMAVAAWMGWSAAYALQSLAVFALGVLLVLQGLAEHAPHERFGAANGLTLMRLAMIALLAGVVGRPLPADPAPLAWVIVVFATTTAVLDAADGPLARTQGLASEFGARFDMECDALLVAVLCFLILQFDKAGAWVLAAGAMRYAFVLAGRVWPWIAQPLFPSWRRKSVCVVQITLLIVCLGPIISRGTSQAIAAAGLLMLSASFAADLGWLYRRRSRRPHMEPST
ncbi:CDP-alcohol phosphatidyltransferase family protein [Variovorax sp. OV329]|uniref:CDP-alcohol phosphatidyltransferase family protein n=1 Tax=Variovorax sp. OV329 TaxID=1882825 RepID=UPI0008E73F6F|nr:CDP-alcohol phosphatidyltransferase family protein [Variovorax sp. OV329]SFN03861.1 Phosphatidylglycerophosphate synthase [Variovorax sp. OV329]